MAGAACMISKMWIPEMAVVLFGYQVIAQTCLSEYAGIFRMYLPILKVLLKKTTTKKKKKRTANNIK